VYFLNYSPYGPIAVGKRAIWRAPRTVAAHEAALWQHLQNNKSSRRVTNH